MRHRTSHTESNLRLLKIPISKLINQSIHGETNMPPFINATLLPLRSTTSLLESTGLATRYTNAPLD